MSESKSKLVKKTLSAASTSVFSLDNNEAYKRWRDKKLGTLPPLEALTLDVETPSALSATERSKFAQCLGSANLAIYKCKGDTSSKQDIQALAGQLGLNQLDSNLCSDEDSITCLEVRQMGRQGGYIPYSNKRLSWHTDGYYNPPVQTVRAIAMHCVRPATQGGENSYLDPEVLYIQLREQEPLWIEALFHPDALTIPPNVEAGKEIRSETKGPVFSVDEQGYLHMRYSARTRNIEWLDNEHIKQATDFITNFLASDSPYIFRYRLNENEGVISNNVLHNRSAFEDDEESKRLLYRARFYQRANIN